MGKGLSKQQSIILGLLDGSEQTLVYSNSSELTTGELVDELEERGLFSEGANRRQKAFTVRRACVALLNRGLIEGRYTTNDPIPFTILSWKATKRKRN